LSGLSAEQKVFGLGLSKTGTSSLTDALNLLGVATVHYPHDERTLRELRAGQYRLSLLDEFQAATDISIAPFYAQLDQAFPASKFILTVREKVAWLRSCEVHWQLLMQWWENFPAFKIFHEFASACTYGVVEFSRARFSFVYDTHVANVRAHFTDRPDDLLVMDICAGDSWEKLCPFLGFDMPDVPFPHANEWMHALLQASKEVSEVVPEGETLILVDDEAFGKDFARGRRCVPLLERAGIDWGAPADAKTAIGELERLRRDGSAGFIAFGWHTFWWLDYYEEFAAHLRSRFRCVMENQRLIIFDLKGQT